MWGNRMQILTDDEYRAMGLRSGLEIHQQLDTGKKLFCRCPVKMTNRDPDARLLRHMRPTLSEMGTYDGTALMEFKTRKKVIYELHRDLVCTYEMDDTPPFPLNTEALEKGIRIALMLQCSLVDELHVSRKQYLDGSIPTGFQRTAIVGIEGRIPYNDREIGIIQLGLEEDACREMSDVGHTITFRTDRLSTPLVEVVTHAHMHTPSEVREVAQRLGRYLRASGLVRRGNGATRQDVNVSITGGRRVEIKGVPKLDWIGRLVAVEALRQRSLLEIRDELAARGVTRDMVESAASHDVSHLFRDSESHYVQDAFLKGWSVRGLVLPRFSGILDRETQPGGVRFRSEFSGRLKVIACLDILPNMADTDEMPVHGISAGERDALKAELGAGAKDVAFMVWGAEEDVRTAMEELKLRAVDALDGVPHETRQAYADGHTEFERILPGANRMYPDTDTPPYPIQEDMVERLSQDIPGYPWDRETRWMEKGVPEHLARTLSISPYAQIFDEITKDGRLGHAFVAAALHDIIKSESRRQGRPFNADPLARKEIVKAFGHLKDGKITKNALKDVIALMYRERITAGEAIARSGHSPMDDEAIGRVIDEALARAGAEHPGPVDVGAIMKGIMPTLRNDADGERVLTLLKNKTGA